MNTVRFVVPLLLAIGGAFVVASVVGLLLGAFVESVMDAVDRARAREDGR